MKHTPGPWVYARTYAANQSRWYIITNAKGYGPIFEVGGKDNAERIISCVNNCKGINPEAVPLMLEACKWLIKEYQESGDMVMGSKLTNKGFLLAEKAITKAEGKQE